MRAYCTAYLTAQEDFTYRVLVRRFLRTSRGRGQIRVEINLSLALSPFPTMHVQFVTHALPFLIH
jgi:hypothetical protein